MRNHTGRSTETGLDLLPHGEEVGCLTHFSRRCGLIEVSSSYGGVANEHRGPRGSICSATALCAVALLLSPPVSRPSTLAERVEGLETLTILQI